MKPMRLVVALLVLASRAGADYPFAEDFESGFGTWITNGTWGLTSASAHSPTRSATDSPGAFYTNNTDAALILATGMDLSGAAQPALRFYVRHELEPGYDFLDVDVSGNGGGTWNTLMRLTGNASQWRRVQLSLSDFIGATDVRLRFRMLTDESVVMDGVYLDDLYVGEAPPPVTLLPVAASQTTARLEWTASADPTFSAYRILRALGTNPPASAFVEVASIPSSATTSWTDIAVSPKSAYTYAIAVMNAQMLESAWSTRSVLTPAGMDYPFLDNGEGSGGLWIAEGSWALSTNRSYSGSSAWSDSPNGDYTNLQNVALMLAAPLDLTTASQPVWSYVHRYQLLPGDSALAEVSTNNGASWIVLASYTAASSTWQRARHDLSAYRTSAQVRVRFRLTTDAGGTADGWWVDDISVAESPERVDLSIPTEVTSDSMRLSWTASTNALFSYYALVRATAPNTGINSFEVVRLFDSSTSTFVDTGLAIDTPYYYRIFAVTPYGTYSPPGEEANARTLNNPVPFTEDFEGSLSRWILTGTWGWTDVGAHGGSRALTDSPGLAYTNNSDSYAYTAVNLTGSVWPVLTFWDRYELANGDSGVLEISTDGTSWSRHYCAMPSSSTNWTKRVVDLSPWRNQSNVRLRFRLLTDNNLNADGWHIDDVSISNHTPASSLTGIFDGFESGTGLWLNDQWRTVTDSVYAGSSALGDGLPGDEINNTTISYVLAAPLDLSAAANSTLTFYLKAFLYSGGGWWPYPNTFVRVQLSKDGGLNWTDLDTQSGWWSNDWTRRQVSIPAAFRTNNVRLRIQAGGGSSNNAMWEPINVWIDNFGLGDPAPSAPTLLSPSLYESVGVLRPTLVIANAHDYQSDPLTYRFEVYRDATLTNVMALIPAIASGATSTSWQVDVNLDNNAQYWWRCRASDGSNDGPWSATSTFYVNETNAPPLMVQVAGPPKGATLRTASGILSWYPTSDPDVGDSIAQYHIQIDDDPAYGSPEVDYVFAGPNPAPTGEFVTISRPLSTLNGHEALGMISNYFWRIRAQDTRFAWSPWTIGGHWFIYGVPSPNAASMVRNANGSITFSWDVGTENWYIQWTPSLTGGWQTIAGPLGVNNWTFIPNPGQTSGFYRIMGD